MLCCAYAQLQSKLAGTVTLRGETEASLARKIFFLDVFAKHPVVIPNIHYRHQPGCVSGLLGYHQVCKNSAKIFNCVLHDIFQSYFKCILIIYTEKIIFKIKLKTEQWIQT
jgi:hypothetical protein